MSQIRTARHDIGSLVQSMSEDVARRIDARTGASSDERGTTEGQRPNVNHPVVAAAARVAESLEGKAKGAAPAAPPSPAAGAAPASAAAAASTAAGAAAAPDRVVKTVEECADLAARVLEAKLKRAPDAEELANELQFSTCDPEWASTIPDYLDYFGVDGKKKPIPYVRYKSLDDFVLPTLPANATVALVGDWGTGTVDARRILEQVARHRPDVLIHLGDIYYSGTPDECQRYFLDVVDEVFDRRSRPIPVYTLTGNHDMYCGGVGYYGLLPKLNPSPPFSAAQAQGASYFALRSTDGAWQLLAMDTSLHDHDPFAGDKDVTYLDPDEEAWHIDKVRRFTAQGGRTVLLSHHQLFSALEAIGDYRSRPADQQAINPRLFATFQKLQQAGDVAAWFWGHEHKLGIYQPWRGLAKGRCIGHGAIPTFRVDDPYKILDGLGADRPQPVADPADPSLPLQPAADDQVYAHGFAILQLDDRDRSATASYYQETSDQAMWVERL